MRRLLLVVLAVLAVSALVAGTGGFTAATMSRDVSISVAATHETALVSIWDPGADETGDEPPRFGGEEVVPHGETRTNVLVVKNRFEGTSVDVTVAHREASPVAVSGESRTLSPGETAPVKGTVDCGTHRGPTDALLNVTARSVRGDVEAVIRFDATVNCGGPARPPSGASGGQTPPAEP